MNVQVFCFFLLSLCAGSALLADERKEIHLESGEVMEVRKVSKVTKEGITVWTDSGPKLIEAAKLSKQERERYGLNLDEAKQAKAERLAQQAEQDRNTYDLQKKNQEIKSRMYQDTSKQNDTKKLSLEDEREAKKAALSKYLAAGGGRVLDGNKAAKGFHYTEGPIKGLTKPQAIEKFESMWAKASDEVKLKYAGISKSDPMQKNPYTEPKSESIDVYTQEGNRIFINGDRSTGYLIEDERLLSYPNRMPTHYWNGSIWASFDQTKHPNIRITGG